VHAERGRRDPEDGEDGGADVLEEIAEGANVQELGNDERDADPDEGVCEPALVPFCHDDHAAPAVVVLGEQTEPVQRTPETGLLAGGHRDIFIQTPSGRSASDRWCRLR
jgi:hypothetical protein